MTVKLSRRELLSGAAAATALSGMSGAQVLAQPRQHDELIDYDALGLAELIKKKEISALELMEIVIRRIEAMEPIVNCITTRTYDRARRKAETIPADSVFAGVPILMKDMIDIGGVRRTDGSRLWLANVPEENVMYVDGVEAAGLNIIGMTNVPEFAQLAIVTNNTAFGETLNPWDLSKSALGSSGGAGAAVAAGILPLVHGTDGGGSNRMPASVAGIFGMKPSHERMLPGEAGGTHGPNKTNQALSRTVRDSAALFDKTEDKTGRVYNPVGLVEGPARRRLRVGYVVNLPGLPECEAGVVEATETAARLMQDLGHIVSQVQFPVRPEEFFRHFNGFFLGRFTGLADTAEALTGVSAQKSGVLDVFTATLLEYGRNFTTADMENGKAYLDRVPGMFADMFKSVDILMSPVLPVVSVAHDILKPTTVLRDRELQILQRHMAYTAPTNIAHIPAMSVPLNWDKETGLPIGTMFQAAKGNDRMLYELAYELEEARPWKDIWAPYSVKNIPI